MARTKIAANVNERLVNRVAILLLRPDADSQLETVFDTLELAGFSPEALETIETKAYKIAGKAMPDAEKQNGK